MGIDAQTTQPPPESVVQVGGTLGPEDAKNLANRIRAGNVKSVDIVNPTGVTTATIGLLIEAAAKAPTDTLAHLRVDAASLTPDDIIKTLCTSLPPLMQNQRRATHTITIAIGGVAVAAGGGSKIKTRHDHRHRRRLCP
jgi:hypothetical protein